MAVPCTNDGSDMEHSGPHERGLPQLMVAPSPTVSDDPASWYHTTDSEDGMELSGPQGSGTRFEPGPSPGLGPQGPDRPVDRVYPGHLWGQDMYESTDEERRRDRGATHMAAAQRAGDWVYRNSQYEYVMRDTDSDSDMGNTTSASLLPRARPWLGSW